MPLYSYRCPDCYSVETHFKRVAARDMVPVCERGASPTPMVRVIEAPMIRPDYAPYNCPVTGKLISGKKEHEANLRKHGARVLEPGEHAQNVRAKAQSEEEFERKISTSIDEAIVALPLEKRERLAAEMSSGLDVNIERTTGKVA